MKINQTQIDLIRLLARSLKPGEDWAKVSPVCCPLLDNIDKDLIEFERTADGGRARLTNEGKAILKWT